MHLSLWIQMHAPSQSASPSSSSLQCNALSNTLSTGLGFLIARNMDKMTTVVCIVCIAFLFILFFYYFKFILWFFVCTSTVLRKHFLLEQQHSSCIVKSPSDTLLCVFVAVCVCVCICECLLLVSECVFVQLSFFICRSYFIILCAFYCSRSGFWFILNKSHLLFNLLFVAFYQNVCIYKSQQATWTSIDIRSLIIGLRWRKKKEHEMRKIAWLANSTAIVVFRVHGLVVYYLFFLPLLDVVIFLEMTPIECVSGSSKIICPDLFWCTAYKYYDKIESTTNFLKKTNIPIFIEWNFIFFLNFRQFKAEKHSSILLIHIDGIMRWLNLF